MLEVVSFVVDISCFLRDVFFWIMYWDGFEEYVVYKYNCCEFVFL